MSLLGRYIALTAIGGTMIALAVLVSMEAMFAVINEISHGYGTGPALLFVLLRMPQRAVETFPIATVIGSLMALGAMAARSELTVMRAVGVSIGRIARWLVAAGLVLGLLAFAMAEWVAPGLERWAHEMRGVAMGQPVASGALSGFWARDGESFVQVESGVSSGQLAGVRIYRFKSDLQLTELVNAERANYRDGHWLLEGVVISRFEPDGVERNYLNELRWESELVPELLDVVVIEPRMMSARELWSYIGYLQRNQLESEQYRLAFWVRVVTPFATLVMLLLTLPMVFGAVRGTNAGQRLFVGILLGISFFLANRLLNQAGLVYGLPPILAASLPTLVVLVVAVWGIARTR